MINLFYNFIKKSCANRQLSPKDKVVIIIGLMSGVVPIWAETANDLPKLVSALTGMRVPSAEKAIKQAVEEGSVKYYGLIE